MEEFEREHRRKRGHELTEAVMAAYGTLDEAMKRLGAEEYAMSVESCRAFAAADAGCQTAEAALRAFVESCA
jgi:hypothetical protein